MTLLTVVLVLTPVTTKAADWHLLVVTGIGGESYYSDLFQRWGTSMLEIAHEQAGFASDHVAMLSEQTDTAVALSNKENVLAAIATLARRSQPNDLILIMLIGHGTGTDQRALFNIPGPDLAAEELAAALEPLAERTLVVVNTSPASSPFLGALSASDRVIITATASTSENNHTRFGGEFIAAYAKKAADANKDGGVSVLEAFNYANREVQRAYELEGRLLTEHAQLDDNGDGVGTSEPGSESADGKLAASLYLGAGPMGLAAGTPFDQSRIALQVEARELVNRIEALKRRKHSLRQADYEQQLEALLVTLALNRRAFRRGSAL